MKVRGGVGGRGGRDIIPFPMAMPSGALGDPGDNQIGWILKRQRGQTVNLLAYAFGGSSPSPPITLQSTVAFGERALALHGRRASRLRRSARGYAALGLYGARCASVESLIAYDAPEHGCLRRACSCASWAESVPAAPVRARLRRAGPVRRSRCERRVPGVTDGSLRERPGGGGL